MDFGAGLVCLAIVILLSKVYNIDKDIRHKAADERKEFARLDRQVRRKEIKAKYDRRND
jgi:hypothetical protein